MRMEMGNCFPTASRMAFSTMMGNRQRFSRLPPYSSVRLLVLGERNWEISQPWAPCTCTMSKPHSFTRAAAAPKAAAISSIISAVMASLMVSTDPVVWNPMDTGISEGPIGRRPPMKAGLQTMPPWDSCIQAFPPYLWISSLHRKRLARTASS